MEMNRLCPACGSDLEEETSDTFYCVCCEVLVPIEDTIPESPPSAEELWDAEIDRRLHAHRDGDY